jgi:hypothetical protein
VKENNVFGNGNIRQGAQCRGQVRQAFNNNGNSGGSNSRFNRGKKLIKACVYFNNGACNKHGDHDEGNVFYTYVPIVCLTSMSLGIAVF